MVVTVRRAGFVQLYIRGSLVCRLHLRAEKSSAAVAKKDRSTYVYIGLAQQLSGVGMMQSTFLAKAATTTILK